MRLALLWRRPAVSHSTTSTFRPWRPGARQRVQRQVRPLVLAHQFTAGALRPNLKLVGGGGTEGIRRAEEDPLALSFQAVSQLADGGGLATPLTPMNSTTLGLVERFKAVSPTAISSASTSRSAAFTDSWS